VQTPLLAHSTRILTPAQMLLHFAALRLRATPSPNAKAGALTCSNPHRTASRIKRLRGPSVVFYSLTPCAGLRSHTLCVSCLLRSRDLPNSPRPNPKFASDALAPCVNTQAGALAPGTSLYTGALATLTQRAFGALTRICLTLLNMSSRSFLLVTFCPLTLINAS
jgi:hypothetical protein